MTAGPGQTARTRAAPLCVPAPAPRADDDALRRIEVVWRVHARALGAHAPDPGARAAELLIRVERLDGAPRAALLVRAPEQAARVIETFDAPGVEVIRDIRSEIHIECPGVLHATIAPGREPGAWRLVYARTPLLDALGVPGGRAEPAGVTAE